MRFFATQPLRSAGIEFDACYALMQATFPAAELVQRAEYEALLQTQLASTHPHWFTLLARWEQGAEPRLVGMVAGSYMRLNGQTDSAMGMIEYLAIAPNDQQQGHAKALLAAFEAQMQAYAIQRGETLAWLAGEVDADLLPFKFQFGYGLPASLKYMQPPIDFDAAGTPMFAAVPKYLVLKPTANQGMALDAAVLKIVIQTMYRWRYVPYLGDESAKMQAAAYLEQHILPPVLASIGEGLIPLRQIVFPAVE